MESSVLLRWVRKSSVLGMLDLDLKQNGTTVHDFDEVYEAHFEFVWRLVCRLGLSDHVDDLVQQVFVVVMRKLHAFEGRSSIRTWLYTIARRVVKDHFRSQRRRPKSEAFDDGIMEAKECSPEDQLRRKQDIQVLYRLLDSLDDDKRGVFVLMELEGMSVAEVARGLSMNENTLYSRLRAARHQFNESVRRFQAEIGRKEQ